MKLRNGEGKPFTVLMSPGFYRVPDVETDFIFMLKRG